MGGNKQEISGRSDVSARKWNHMLENMSKCVVGLCRARKRAPVIRKQLETAIICEKKSVSRVVLGVGSQERMGTVKDD